MPVPLEITFKDIDPSSFIESRVRERADRLERFHRAISRCHVAIEAPHRHGRKGTIYSVHITVHVPGAEVVVNRSHGQDHAHEDVYVAIRDSFDAMERRLEDHARRLRGDVKSHEEGLTGHVVRLVPEGRYGFVATSDGQEIYFHADAVVGQGYPDLAVGTAVRLVIAEGDGPDGPQASTVQPISALKSAG